VEAHFIQKQKKYPHALGKRKMVDHLALPSIHDEPHAEPFGVAGS